VVCETTDSNNDGVTLVTETIATEQTVNITTSGSNAIETILSKF